MTYHTTEWYREVYFNDKYRCVYCGKNMLNDLDLWLSLEVDHIIPQSKGGTDESCNLVSSCNVCNKTKSNYYSGELNAKMDNLKEEKSRNKVLDDIRNYILKKRLIHQIRWIYAQEEYDNKLKEKIRES